MRPACRHRHGPTCSRRAPTPLGSPCLSEIGPVRLLRCFGSCSTGSPRGSPRFLSRASGAGSHAATSQRQQLSATNAAPFPHASLTTRALRCCRVSQGARRQSWTPREPDTTRGRAQAPEMQNLTCGDSKPKLAKYLATFCLRPQIGRSQNGAPLRPSGPNAQHVRQVID